MNQAHLHSHLHKTHVSLGAKFVNFAGWEMPLSYKNGTLSEHSACRNATAVFDVSHLGRIFLEDAKDYLQWQLTNDLELLQPQNAHYTLLLSKSDGSIVDDLICVNLTKDKQLDRYLLILNAGNKNKVQQIIEENGKSITPQDERYVFLAIQGPESKFCLGKIFSENVWSEKNKVQSIAYKGEEILMLGTGYTGEIGVECIVPLSIAEVFFLDLLEAGAVPAGLGARDILRLEAGFPLYGQDLASDVTPLQAQLGWAVTWEKEDFCGKEALLEERKLGPHRLLCGLAVENERRPIRAGTEVYFEGRNVGKVTSGNYSPSLNYAIGMALIDAEVKESSVVELKSDLNSKQVLRKAQVRNRNFYSPSNIS